MRGLCDGCQRRRVLLDVTWTGGSVSRLCRDCLERIQNRDKRTRYRVWVTGGN